MPQLPHNFPTLRRSCNGNPRPSVLLLGSGMSHGLVPLINDLILDKRKSAESKLGCASTALDPYEWADEIFNQLTARNDPNPKLTLAKSLEITSDPCWRGYVSTERSAPRHRIIARFAREGLWHQVWSLNWDCVQESAFENVGIKRVGTDTQLPWPTVFHTFITAENCELMGMTDTVKIVKPHGCVLALVKAEEAKNRGDDTRARRLAKRFLITKTELTNLSPSQSDGTQQFIYATLCEKLCTRPFVVAGWKASENYLLNYMETHVCPALTARTLADDELSIIVPTFRDTHERLARLYGKDKNATHIPVQHDNGFTLDQFFLWLQALYAVECLNQWAPDADTPAIGQLAAMIEQPPDTPLFVDDWVDNFLPVWVRLCWRCELIKCCNRNAQLVKANQIYLESPDEHIPWSINNIDRPELKTAARLLSVLYRSGNADKWNFEIFPGGLYQDNHLVIPLPAWGETPNDLRGLKALIDAIKQQGSGYIDKLSVLLLCPDAAGTIPEGRKQEIKEVLAREVALARFAQGSDIEEMNLEDL